MSPGPRPSPLSRLRGARFACVVGVAALVLLRACGPEDPAPDAGEASTSNSSTVNSSTANSSNEPASPDTAGPPAIPGANDDADSPRDQVPAFPGEAFTFLPEVGRSWKHVTSNSGEYRLPEIMSGGLALFDFDGDDDLDVFLVQAGTWNDLTPGARYPGHALLRNDGAMHFTDVAREAGVFGPDGFYGHGAVAADYDQDGDVDLYVTGFERNLLYRNDGHGHFDEVAKSAGVAGGAFSTSACFFDADGDGWLDLYVANYIAYSHEFNRAQTCGKDSSGQRDYCSPRMFDGVQDYFFRNRGDGTFEECAESVGLGSPKPIRNNSKGLGVIASDLDRDGDLDVYVANDATANLLFLNDGTGHFEECGTDRGCGFSPDGIAQAGMGLDSGDVDGDGLFDLWVVHLDSEDNALYRNTGAATFVDGNVEAGLNLPARGKVGFGTDLFDFDHDGDLDVAIAHGHVLMHADTSRQTVHYHQESQLLENVGGCRFALMEPERGGGWFSTRHVGRGLVTGDLDGDGDLDLVIASRDASPSFLRNNHEQRVPGNVDAVQLELRVAGRAAAGAKVSWTAGGRVRVEEVHLGSSYCSAPSPVLLLGLGEERAARDVKVLWPNGTERLLGDLPGGARYRVDAEGGEPRRVPFRTP